MVDIDGSGQIEFNEFLLIIKLSNADEKTAKINKFFKDMTQGVLVVEGLSFNQIVASTRRAYMMDAILCTHPER